MYKLRVPDHLVEFLRGFHPELKRKIKGSLKHIAAEPDSGKPLKEELEGLRSLRVSRIRIVYQIAEPREIQIIAMGPRERIYEETYRLIRKESEGSSKKGNVHNSVSKC
jgi:mRNA interferase RelE/StbE